MKRLFLFLIPLLTYAMPAADIVKDMDDEPVFLDKDNFIAPEKESETIDSIVLVDESAQQTLALLEKLTGKIILPQQNIPKVRINLNINTPLSKEEAILAIESILVLNGIAITEMGDKFLKAVPTSRVKSQSPTFLSESSLPLVSSENIYTKFFRLTYLSTDEIRMMLAPSMTPESSALVTLQKSNSILVTDTLSNIQRVEQILEKIDKPADVREEVLFYALKNTSAKDLVQHLTRFQSNIFGKYLKGNTSFEADDRTNQLIVITPPGHKPLIDQIVKGLDLDIQPLTKSEVFYIKHAQAKDLCAVLKRVITSQQDKEEKKDADKKDADKKDQDDQSKTPAQTFLDRLRQMREQQQKPTTGSSESAQKFSKDFSLDFDERSNAIIVFGNPTDIRQIKELIDKVDIVLPQVRVQVIIAEVKLTNDQVSGLQSFGIGYNEKYNESTTGTTILKNGEKIYLKNISSAITTKLSSPFTLNGSLQDFAIDTVFQKAQENQNIQLLSAPMILTTHNQEASVTIGEKRPIVEAVDTNKTDTNNVTQRVKYQDIGITLKIKPLIGSNGTVQLKIDQTVDNISGSTTINNNSQPIITNRTTSSFVSVNDRDTIVLSGLQERTNTKTKSKVFLLGYLPFLGSALFSPESDVVETRELILFIRPQVVYMPSDAVPHAKQMMEQIDGGKDIQTFTDTGKFPLEKTEPEKGSKATSRTEKLYNKKMDESK